MSGWSAQRKKRGGGLVAMGLHNNGSVDAAKNYAAAEKRLVGIAGYDRAESDAYRFLSGRGSCVLSGHTKREHRVGF